MTLDELYEVIKDRKKNMPQNSYIASLLKESNDRIIQKVGEEAVEVVIAAKNGNKKEIITETADLFFHILILLANFDITIEDINKELTHRENRTKKVV